MQASRRCFSAGKSRLGEFLLGRIPSSLDWPYTSPNVLALTYTPFPYACLVSEPTASLWMRIFKTIGRFFYCLCFSSKFLSSLSFHLSCLTLVTSQKPQWLLPACRIEPSLHSVAFHDGGLSTGLLLWHQNEPALGLSNACHSQELINCFFWKLENLYCLSESTLLFA